jgi:hypothetical protein
VKASPWDKQQRRAEQRLTAARHEQERLEKQRRTRRRLLASVVVLVAAVVAAVLLALSLGSSKAQRNTGTSTPGATPVVTQPFRPGSQASLWTTAPPWPLPSDARPFIAAAGLAVLKQEALAVHYHAHLDIIVNGSAVLVPAGVGFVITNGLATGITVLHTHDTSGIIHIESPVDVPYTLGQFFTEWGVRLGHGELGGLIHTDRSTLRVYVNGHEFIGDPASIVLRAHQELALWYGRATATPHVQSSYAFPLGD